MLSLMALKLPSLIRRSTVLTLTLSLLAASLLVSRFSRMPLRMEVWRVAPKKRPYPWGWDRSGHRPWPDLWPSFLAKSGITRRNLSRRFRGVSSTPTEGRTEFERL